MSNSEHDGLAVARKLYYTFCVLLFIVAIWVAVYRKSEATSSHQAAAADFSQRFCENEQTYDLLNQNPPHFTVQLSPGCFAPHIKLPKTWTSWEPQLSQNPQDWVSVWCAGHPKPSQPLHPQDYLDPSFTGCFDNGESNADFFLQGHGVLTFIRTSGGSGKSDTSVLSLSSTPAAAQNELAHEPPHESPHETAHAPSEIAASATPPSNPNPVPSPPTAPAYKLTVVDPIPPNSSQHSFVMQECHRDGENIVCDGKMINNTDAGIRAIFHSSQAVDSEGNTVNRIAMPGFVDLIPNTPTNVEFRAEDAHTKARTITFEMVIVWHDSSGDYVSNTMDFSNIPIQ